MSSSGADMAGRFAGSGQGFVMKGTGADMAGQFAGSGQGFVMNGFGADMAGGFAKAVREPRQTVPGTKLVWAGIKV